MHILNHTVGVILFFILEEKERKKNFLLSDNGSHVGNTKQSRENVFSYLVQQMTDILFIFELDTWQILKFVIFSLEIQFWEKKISKQNKKLLVLLTHTYIHKHTDNLSFNFTERLFVMLVITCCSRTFLPHFLAENFKNSMRHVLVSFYWQYPCIMLFHVHIISFL